MTLDQWIASTEALLYLDEKKALAPHGIGGHARTLLEYALQSLRAAAPSGDEVDAALASWFGDDWPSMGGLARTGVKDNMRAALSAAASKR